MLELMRPDRHAIRRRKVTLADSVNISYGVHGAGFLGDCIQAVQCALMVNKRLGRKVGVHPWGMGHDGQGAGYCVAGVIQELLNLFQCEDRVEMVAPEVPPRRRKFVWRSYIGVPMFDPFLDEPPVEYELVKQPWGLPYGLPGMAYGRVCYQFYGRSNWRQQNFHKPDAVALYNWIPDTVDKVKLGQPLTISDCVEVMRNSDLFIGINSGMTLLARSVGVPTFVNPQRIPMDWFYRWNKQDSSSYCIFRNLNEFAVRLRERLPWLVCEL